MYLKQRLRNLSIKEKYTEITGSFNENSFNQDLHNQLSTEQPKDYASFEKIFLSILEEHASLKEKLLDTNHAPYVTKALRKAIIGRSYLGKLYLKKITPSYLKKYQKQKNIVVRCIKRSARHILINKSKKTFGKNIHTSQKIENLGIIMKMKILCLKNI